MFCFSVNSLRNWTKHWLSECPVTSLHYAPPSPILRKDVEEVTLGRGIHLRGEGDAPPTPSKHQEHLSLSLRPVWLEYTFEESTFHLTPQFLTNKEESSTYPSSGLCWRDTIRRRRNLRLGDLFSGQSVAPQSVSSMEDQITDQKTVLRRISFLLYSQSLITVPAHLRKAAHPSHWLWVRLAHIFSWNLGRRKSSQEA